MELPPSFPTLQRVVLYETKARFFLVACDRAESCFRVLKIDRTEPYELVITEDKTGYTEADIRELLNRIYDGQGKNNRMNRKVSAYGIFGFVKFLEGYYIILITERKRIAYIGSHAVYKVEDTTIFPIPNNSVRVSHPDEGRYLKIFQNVDLSSNFYFSYTYDLTNTLQHNVRLSAGLATIKPPASRTARFLTCVRRNYSLKFVWNDHLLKPAINMMHPEWTVPVIHGYFQQAYVPVYNCPLYLTVIARRSRFYAGTRFLKRGANDQGKVANEVETEVIASIASSLSLTSGNFTSYVSHRGSVPLPWSQEHFAMVPKPPIRMDRPDPFGSLAAQHFCELFERYGTPIMVFNLIKKHEKRPRESILGAELKPVIDYLNQFLPPDHKIDYVAWDMARFTKIHQSQVIEKLEEMSEQIVRRTGFFHNGRELYCNQQCKDKSINKMGRDHYSDSKPWRFQTGVVRVNCVDCIDRTNTAQFVIHRQALGYQLYSLGVIDDPHLLFESDIMRLFEGIFEAHGDTIALQYGGSQLVHSIRTYRKASPWALQSRDILHSVSRYYSNAFTDFDKQMGMNLFLGVFQPKADRPHLWELPTDYYLHHDLATGVLDSMSLPSYTWWFGDKLRHLPFPAPPEESKPAESCQVIDQSQPAGTPFSTSFEEFYQPTQLTVFEKEHYMDDMNNTRKNYMPSGAEDISPFVIRKDRHQVKQPSEASRKTAAAHPSMSISGEDSDTGEDSSDEVDKDDAVRMPSKQSIPVGKSFERGTSLSKDPVKLYYGFEIKDPVFNDMELYKRYSRIGYFANQENLKQVTMTSVHYQLANLVPCQYFSADSLRRVISPEVRPEDRQVYENSVKIAQFGPKEPTLNDKKMYSVTVEEMLSL
eukprot:m.31126 g.31126  ORF g.31126 m.31126 type:complete len:875 (+) comp31452_c0_seq2:148-2772(+)